MLLDINDQPIYKIGEHVWKRNNVFYLKPFETESLCQLSVNVSACGGVENTFKVVLHQETWNIE